MISQHSRVHNFTSSLLFLLNIIKSGNLADVTWSTTERRETRNFPYPSVFELTGPKGWPLKEEIRILVKLSVLHNLTRVDREGDIEIRIVVWMNRLTGWGRRKRPNDWPEPEVAPFSSDEIEKERIQFLGRRLRWKGVRISCKNSGRRNRKRVLG